MKIIRIIARINVGGPARHVIWLTKEFNDSEFQTVLLAGTVPPGEEDMAWFAEENGVSPVFIEELSRELSLKDIISLWKIYKRLRKEKPDVIHTHTAKAGTIGRIAGMFYRLFSRKKVSIIHTFHGHIFHSYYGNLKTKIFLLIEKFLARFATDKIVVISEQQFEEIHREFGIGTSSQFEIVPLGIDLKSFSEPDLRRNILRDELGAAETDIIVGFVGRLTEIKNISLILKAAKLFREQKTPESPNIRFVIVGDGNLRNELEAESASYELQETVRFVGNLENIADVYAALDVVALSSLNEGTPLSLIEAMANGKPVISSAVGGVIDLLGDVEAEHDRFNVCQRGLRYDSNDEEGLFNSLIHLAREKSLREGLGARGKSFVQDNYSKHRLFEDIRKLYRDLQ
jgi:glycosyltransferase involved in cell wall biosynthesis